MSDVDVTVETVPDPTGDLGDAIDHVVDNEQSLLIGNLLARVEALEAKVTPLESSVEWHDDLITLHDHAELATTADLTECEDRLAARIEELAPETAPEAAGDEIETSSEEQPESEQTAEQETSDSPPNSRRQRGSVANWYYSSSKL